MYFTLNLKSKFVMLILAAVMIGGVVHGQESRLTSTPTPHPVKKAVSKNTYSNVYDDIGTTKRNWYGDLDWNTFTFIKQEGSDCRLYFSNNPGAQVTYTATPTVIPASPPILL